MARTKQPTTEPIVPTPAEVEAANAEAARAVVRADAARALAEGERLERMQAVARECGYALADSLFSAAEVVADAKAHLKLYVEQQIAANGSLFRVGQALLVLREGCAHGEWNEIAQRIGMSEQHARRLIAVTRRFILGNDVTADKTLPGERFDDGGGDLPALRFPKITSAAASISKMAELLAFSDEELAELEETGEVLGVTLPDISAHSKHKLHEMLARARRREQAAEHSAEEMREALIRSRNENEALSRLLGEKSLEIEKLKRRDDGAGGDNAAAFEDAIATLHARARGVRLAVAQMEDAAQTAMRYGDCLLLTAACVQMQIQALREIQGNMALPLLPDTDLPRFKQQVMLGRAAEYMADRDEDADATWGDDDGQE